MNGSHCIGDKSSKQGKGRLRGGLHVVELSGLGTWWARAPTAALYFFEASVPLRSPWIFAGTDAWFVWDGDQGTCGLHSFSRARIARTIGKSHKTDSSEIHLSWVIKKYSQFLEAKDHMNQNRRVTHDNHNTARSQTEADDNKKC